MQVSCINSVNAGLGCGLGEQDEMKDNLITRSVWVGPQRGKAGPAPLWSVKGRTGPVLEAISQQHCPSQPGALQVLAGSRQARLGDWRTI